MNFHFNAAMNTGTTPEQMRDFVKVIETEVGADYAKTAQNVLDRILAKRSVQAK
jgi:4-carboxymuconolactone decarboxylase